MRYHEAMNRAEKPKRFLRAHISTLAFVLGFLWDTLTLGQVDSWYDQTVLAIYMLFVPAAILLLHAVESGRFRVRWLSSRKHWLPALIQFPIGGLFSAFIVFYSKSASVWTSWPFLLLLVAMFVGNELMHKRYERLVFQVGAYYVTLFTYLALLVPTLLGTLGTAPFVLAGVLSVALIGLFTSFVAGVVPVLYRESRHGLMFTIGGIYVVFHVLYLTNLIPPVPLVLKDMGVYYSVARSDNGYTVTGEPRTWAQEFGIVPLSFRQFAGAPAYCFSAVYAPARLRTNMYHTWLYKDGLRYTSEARIVYPMRGGREEGYRGYTMKAVRPGEWRCRVETASGQVLGQMDFTVSVANEPPMPLMQVK